MGQLTSCHDVRVHDMAGSPWVTYQAVSHIPKQGSGEKHLRCSTRTAQCTSGSLETMVRSGPSRRRLPVSSCPYSTEGGFAPPSLIGCQAPLIVYKAQEHIHRSVADLRLLAIPTSRRRVAAFDLNWGMFFGICSPSRVGVPLYMPL
jgi:hypothetical protein